MTDETNGNSANLNLLFAFLALQMNFIDRDQLLQAMSTWISDKTKSLSDIFIDLGFVSEQRRSMLDTLVQEHLEQNNNDTEKSLLAVQTATMSLAAVREALGRIGDTDIEHSIIRTMASPTVHKFEYSPTQQFSETTEMMQSQRFRVLRPHAKGGLGQVSVARDNELNREVALKEIQPQYADDQMSRNRFLLEAEITGQLEHPGIVPVYGLGNYSDGRPYYAMRFIRGDNLKSAIVRYHKNKQSSKKEAGELSLEFRRLLRRFIDACNALEYAHSRQVLHRDIKPGNIMLGKYGETMIVDWGMAKTLDTNENEPTVDLDQTPITPLISKDIFATSMGSKVGTPSYMSPEQAAGQLDLLGPLSDIYGLGATLFHLLTGRPPFRDKDIGSVLNRVKAGDFEPPRQLDPTVPKPLEVICLKAMATDIEQRYQSALNLADDLEHWLADEPISALKENLWQRTARWFRKHKTWTQAATLTLLTITIVSTVATVVVNNAKNREQTAKEEAVEAKEAESLARKQESNAKEDAERQRDYAINRFRQARENINRWVVGGAEALNQHWLTSEYREEFLELAVQELEELTEQEVDLPSLEIERGRAYINLANGQRLLKKFDEAEKNYRNALNIFQQQTKEPDVQLEAQLDTARTNTHLGLLFAEIKEPGSKVAESFYQEALKLIQPILEAQPNMAVCSEIYGQTQLNLGNLYRSRNDFQRAAHVLRETIERLKNLLKQSPAAGQYIIPLAKAQNSLADVLTDQGFPHKALEQFQQATNHCEFLLEKTLEEEINQGKDHLEALETLATSNLGRAKVLGRLGRYVEQIEAYKFAIDSYSRLETTRPHIRRYKENQVVAVYNWAATLYKLGETKKAENNYRLSVNTFQKLERMYNLPEYAERLATSIDATGRVFSDQDKNQDAVEVFRRANTVFSTLARDYPDIPRYRERMAVTQNLIGKTLHKLAEKVEILKDQNEPTTDTNTKLLELNSETLEDEALQEIESSIKTFDQLIEQLPDLPQLHAEIAMVYKTLAWIQWDRNNKSASRIACVKAIEHWKMVTDIPNLPSVDYLNQLALFLLFCPNEDLRDTDAAARYATQAQEAAPENAFYCVSLGIAAYRAGNWSVAIEWLDKATELRGGKSMGRELFFLAMSHWQLLEGPNDLAEKHYQNALAWMKRHRPGNIDLQRIRDEASQLREELTTE